MRDAVNVHRGGNVGIVDLYARYLMQNHETPPFLIGCEAFFKYLEIRFEIDDGDVSL